MRTGVVSCDTLIGFILFTDTDSGTDEQGRGSSYLNVVVAHKIWNHAFANKSIQIMCDNIAVVEVLTFGRARDPIMASCARNIWLLAAMFNINIVVCYVRDLDNTVVDLLSRWQTNS